MHVSWRDVSLTAIGQYTSEPLRTAATEKMGSQAPPHSHDRARSILQRFGATQDSNDAALPIKRWTPTEHYSTCC
jgi:hypothetical protein